MKRFIVEKGKPSLHAENPRYPDLIPVHDLAIQGVMVGLVRAFAREESRRARP